MDTQPKPSVAVIGGGGSRPAIISWKKEIPSSSRAAAAEAAGSAHSYVRRLPSESLIEPSPQRSRQPRFPFRIPAATILGLATARRPGRGPAAAQRPALVLAT